MTHGETRIHDDILAAMKIENLPISCHFVSYWAAVGTKEGLVYAVANKPVIGSFPLLRLNPSTFLCG